MERYANKNTKDGMENERSEGPFFTLSDFF